MKLVKPFWRDAGVQMLGKDALRLGAIVGTGWVALKYGKPAAKWFLSTPAGDWVGKQLARVFG